MTDASAVVEKLLEVEAVKLSPHQPFTWTSGIKSPIYCDNRRLLSFPYARDFVKSEMCSVIFQSFPDADVIAGVATAGISWGAMAADQLKLPFAYVRSEAKQHGMKNLIEGYIPEGSKVLVVEDLISTAKSSLKVCEAIRENGSEVCGVVAIFTYQFPEALEAFEKLGIPVYTLANYETLLDLALKTGKINNDAHAALMEWRKNPAAWAGL